MKRCGKTLRLGFAEIRAFSDDGKVYAAPNLMFHYIVDHSYLPPSEFIDAVLKGPRPSHPSYFKLLRRKCRGFWRDGTDEFLESEPEPGVRQSNFVYGPSAAPRQAKRKERGEPRKRKPR